MTERSYLILVLVLIQCQVFAQGSWNPPGFDPRFPRTLLDSNDIPAVRASLTDPDHISLFSSIWLNANSTVPAGNSTNIERLVRSNICREAAFAYLMDRKFSAGTIMQLTQDERDSLRNRVISLLEQLNTEVDVGTTWNFYTPWQYRSKELIASLVSYDLLKGAGVPQSMLENSRSKLLTFTANLYQKAMATYLGFLKFFTFQFNNHSIMTASALGLAAIVFNDQSSTNVNYQPLSWINAGLYNLDNTLWLENDTYPRVSEPDTLAGYAEGPHYFRYAFENAYPFIRAMGVCLPDGNYPATFNSTTRNIRNPWSDPRYDRLCDWMNKIRMPDGSCPAIHDSYMGFGTVIMALSGKPQYNLPNPGFTADDPAIRTQYISTNVSHGAIRDSVFQALPAAGSLVFRSSWEPTAVYMHFIGKHGIALTGAKSHHQGDASGFSLAAYGELLCVDPGYPGASQAGLENKAIDHSLVLVNGTGPLPPTGEYVSTSTNTAYIEHCFDTPLLDYGEVRVSYQGADIIRKNLFIRNGYFLLTDFVSSGSSKNYTFQLHGNGLFGSAPTLPTGSFMPDFNNSQAVYSRNDVSLLARITTPGSDPVFSFDADSMAIGEGFRKYSRLLVQKNNVTGTLFLSMLYPFTSVAPQASTAGKDDIHASVRTRTGDHNDLAFCSQTGTMFVISADSSGMNKQVKGNGKICFLSECSDGQFSSAFLQDGDSLVSATQVIIQSAVKMDIAWMNADADLSCGYVSGAGVVGLISGKPLQLILGPVSSLAYDTLRHLAVVTFTGKGNFIFGPSNLTWVWTGLADENWHNPENWQMLDHPLITGVPSATNNVLIPAPLLRMPVISSDDPATCHDLTINAGASVTVGILKFLTVEGTLTVRDPGP